MTLYLSRLSLDRNAPTAALAQLLDPNDANRAADAHHRLIWTVFSDASDRERDFLWRAEGGGRFLTLSKRPPLTNDLFAPPEIKPFEPDLRRGDRLQFTLRANATRDRARGQREGSMENRRVDVVMDLLHEIPKGRRADHRDAKAIEAAQGWLSRQAETRGFQLVDLYVEGYTTLDLARRGRRARLGILDLSGLIEITEPAAFLPALTAGFGRAKAWGCGLMLIRRAG
ncbi:type I-E CRISPR-associated protein Cas6/Cse3/CasE [Pikeienuella sp. HZG-20]|uniref:type I-E CRISPR-associated protein Cas6/Cse3/CasE n=1 Tax=Paludibacillus litoralis TaxID=3133267 RepID=UPI0030EC6BA4